MDTFDEIHCFSIILNVDILSSFSTDGLTLDVIPGVMLLQKFMVRLILLFLPTFLVIHSLILTGKPEVIH